MKTLECSSKGDKRFSAVYAKVTLGNGENKKTKSIEEWYQLSKVFVNEFNDEMKATNWKQAKAWQHQGLKIVRCECCFTDCKDRKNICCIELEKEKLSLYYKYLWFVYFLQNPELYIYAEFFNDFTDCFKTDKTINCQADVIKEIVNNGLLQTMLDLSEIILLTLYEN